MAKQPPFATGDVVVHDKFGRGVVMGTPISTTNGAGVDGWRAEIDFEGKGSTSVATSFLKLESEVHQIDRLRTAVQRYGQQTLAADRLLRQTGAKLLQSLVKYLHRSKTLAFGVPPNGEWRPAADYRDAVFSSYHEPVLTLAPLDMGVAIQIDNLDDDGACWLRLAITMERHADHIKLRVGDTALPSLALTCSDTDLTTVAAAIVDLAESVFRDTRCDAQGYYDGTSAIGFLWVPPSPKGQASA